MLAPVIAPNAPPTHAPLRPLTPWPMAAPMPPPTSAPRSGSPPAEAVVGRVPTARVVAMTASIKGFFSIEVSKT